MTIPIRRVSLSDITPAERAALVTRTAVPDRNIRNQAADIVDDVRNRGDQAVHALNTRHGGGSTNGALRVSEDAFTQATVEVGVSMLAALQRAIDAVRSVHVRQIPVDTEYEPTPGVSIRRTWSPMHRVGVYVPGGGANYPSSLVMGVVPAQVAGVEEIAVVCPASPSGSINAGVLAAAHMLGVSEVYTTGGAQAIGALAFGTESIGKVQKIVGPGGPWVTAAKLAVYGGVGVDLPAGPSEAAVIVDATTDPSIAASDLLCQAEHGPDSIVALVTADAGKANEVMVELSSQLLKLERRDIIERALTAHGLVVIAPDRTAALTFVNDWAPEHASVLTEHPGKDAESITAAGSVFVGEWSPESAGDYATGANHILPTGGLAAAYGPLATEDFGSWRQVQELTRAGLENLAPTITTLAQYEGLTAHAAAVETRLQTTQPRVSI